MSDFAGDMAEGLEETLEYFGTTQATIDGRVYRGQLSEFEEEQLLEVGGTVEKIRATLVIARLHAHPKPEPQKRCEIGGKVYRVAGVEDDDISYHVALAGANE